MVLLRAKAPGMSLSVLILREKINFEKSKLTRRDIGMMELNNKI